MSFVCVYVSSPVMSCVTCEESFQQSSSLLPLSIRALSFGVPRLYASFLWCGLVSSRFYDFQTTALVAIGRSARNGVFHICCLFVCLFHSIVRMMIGIALVVVCSVCSFM